MAFQRLDFGGFQQLGLAGAIGRGRTTTSSVKYSDPLRCAR